jgi:SMODS-associating 4TM effector domain
MSAAEPIPVAQERPEAIREATAFARRYEVAQRFRAAILGIGLGFPVLGSVTVVLDSGAGVVIGALAGLWAGLFRYPVERFEESARRNGALAQDLFDCRVLGLPWNSSLLGPKPALEDISDWAGKRDSGDRHDWYPAEVGPVVYPLDALLCQRANAVWGRRNHARYAYIAVGLIALLFLVTVAVAVIEELSTVNYLARLGLPALPALLIGQKLLTGHREQERLKRQVEEDADQLYDVTLENGTPPSPAQCREFQDSLYTVRAGGASIPRWYYKLRLGHDEHAMREAVAIKIADLPAALQRSDS